MIYTVSITSQGQISIPAKLRRQLGLENGKKALISVEEEKLIVEPIEDFSALKGVFKTNKKIPFKKIHEAFGDYLAKEAVKGLR